MTMRDAQKSGPGEERPPRASERSTIFSYLDRSGPAVVGLQSLLTSIPALAPESGGDGEMEKAEALVGWLAGKGIRAIERYDAPDPRVSSGLRPNIVATIPGSSDEGRLWIMTHLDVVPAGDLSMWSSDPFKVVHTDGKVMGRGVEDDQQDMVASILAALAFTENGLVPTRTIKLLFVADEEVGSKYGICHLLKKAPGLFHGDDLIVIPDGGSADGSKIEVAEKNICWLRVVTKGKQTHAATPDQGANAFLAASALALAAHALEREVFKARDGLFEPDRTTINPTKKEANVPNVNTIPGDDVFYLDMRILPQYPVARVLEEVSKRMRVVEKEYGVTVSYEVLESTESKPTRSDAPVVTALGRVVRSVYGIEAKAIGIGGGTVGAHLRNAGLECVVWGRVDDTAHQPNEYSLLANTIGDAKVFAALALE